MSNLHFRWADAEDFTELGELMYDSVHHADSQYSNQQRLAWIAEPRKGKAWNQRLETQHIIVIENPQSLVGFMSLTLTGYVDFAYIRPAFQQQGLFRRLYTQIEIRARELGLKKLTTHASLMARPAFKAVGFDKAQKETVERDGIALERFSMQKTLKKPAHSRINIKIC